MMGQKMILSIGSMIRHSGLYHMTTPATRTAMDCARSERTCRYAARRLMFSFGLGACSLLNDKGLLFSTIGAQLAMPCE